MFIRDVKLTANQLGHGNDSILNWIKACIPTEIYGTLYSITDLEDLIKMVKDIYAMKPDTSKTTTMTSTTPSSTMQSKIATQSSFNLVSASFPGFPNDDFYRYYDNNRLGCGYTNNYQGQFHRGNNRYQGKVDFIQIAAI